ncbi:MAG: Helicase associated domain protein [Lachnospiraceae bacterium]|nr:Helicase associated domain protein [Lachnospiraceae bacterium]
MGTILFEHNQRAYEAVLSMLSRTGKAAVIHPTGTGKSFIAFRLCEEHAKETVCWLSPSGYIFRTQVEKWSQAGGKKIENIRFFTYAKLMRMGEDELGAIKPDYLVLDEFHRCGAIQWGDGVKRLMARYPKVPVLGLSATNIRYLDARRDMAWELFDGNIASELSLGAAIARGILPEPKYVLSVYSYQKELARYEMRVRQTKSKAVRDAAEKELEVLRRALEKADGLEEVFARHMLPEYQNMSDGAAEDRVDNVGGQRKSEYFDKIEETVKSIELSSELDYKKERFRFLDTSEKGHNQKGKTAQLRNPGKYIVFCASYEHLLEMKALAPEWFSKVDRAPHIYTAYSDDPGAAREFEAFKCDKSGHLKLLYCIDMLNEGIHVDGVDGVILLRPTVSPTIYKQQVGRALAAGGKKIPVIFDIVLNIENLLSVGAVEEELQEAVLACRREGREEEIIREHFRVVDELADCRELFRRLNDTLGASWDTMYGIAEEYYRKYGDLEVPGQYVTPDGYSLGAWLNTQRKVYTGKAAGSLTLAQAERLTAIGMRWQGTQELAWEKNFAEAKKYFGEHGNLDVPKRYVAKGGKNLGGWLQRQRMGRRQGQLSTWQVMKLEQIGMVWEAAVPWQTGFLHAREYYRENGHLEVPNVYVCKDGYRLGKWISNQRSAYASGNRLTEEQIQELAGIGMVWHGKLGRKCERGIGKMEGE